MQHFLHLTYRRAFWLILMFSLLITVAGLNVRELESGDETRVAGIAAEMFFEGDRLVPRLNGEPFLEYPPFYYWCASLSYGIFGVNDFAAKLPAALAAAGCGILLFLFAAGMKFRPWNALTAAVMLMTSTQFFGNSRKCMVDMVLAFFILLAIYAFYMLLHSGRFRDKAIFFLLFAAGLAGGMLTKGLLGAVLPLAVLGSWLVAGDFLKRRISFRRYFLLGAGTLPAVGGVGIWYLLLYRAEGMEMLHTVLWVNNFGRFTGSQGDHVEPFYYYLVKLPSLFWPWLPLLPFALFRAFREVRKRPDGELLVLLFLLVPFLLFTCASGKRTVYLLPLYAPAALLCADYLRHLPEFIRKIARQYRRPLCIYLIAVLYCLLFALAACSRSWAMAYPLAAVLLLTLFLRRPRGGWSLPLAGGMAALLFASIDTASATFLNPRDSLRPLFEECLAREREGFRITLLSPPERTSGAAYFYLHRRVPEVSRDEEPLPGELRITRRKRNKLPGREFADHHILLGLPPEQTAAPR